jgi:hypothetical protein
MVNLTKGHLQRERHCPLQIAENDAGDGKLHSFETLEPDKNICMIHQYCQELLEVTSYLLN